MSKSQTDHHNDGQHDRSEHRGYSPPHGGVENALTWSRDECDKISSDNKAYNSGWKNTDDQKK